MTDYLKTLSPQELTAWVDERREAGPIGDEEFGFRLASLHKMMQEYDKYEELADPFLDIPVDFDNLDLSEREEPELKSFKGHTGHSPEWE